MQTGHKERYLGDNMKTKQSIISNNLLTFPNVGIPLTNELDFAVDQWFKVLLAQIHHENTVVLNDKSSDSIGNRYRYSRRKSI